MGERNQVVRAPHAPFVLIAACAALALVTALGVFVYAKSKEQRAQALRAPEPAGEILIDSN